MWEGLTVPGEVPEEANRSAYYRSKVDMFAKAQHDGILRDDPEPGALLFSIMALAAWWHAAPHIARLTTGTDAADLDARRAAVMTAARRLAAA